MKLYKKVIQFFKVTLFFSKRFLTHILQKIEILFLQRWYSIQTQQLTFNVIQNNFHHYKEHEFPFLLQDPHPEWHPPL